MSRAEKKAHVLILVRTAQTLQNIGDIAGADATWAAAQRMRNELARGR